MRQLFLLSFLFVFLPPAAASGLPLIVAHRGASHDAPENTLASFRLAWRRGADAIEGDFYLSSDGKIVCIHDKSTKRTAGRDLRVADTTFAELKRLDVGAWKDKKWKGERIPTLGEVFTTVPAGKKILIEVKCGPEIARPLKRAIKESSLNPDQIRVIAFDRNVIASVKREMPRIKAYWLTGYKEDKKTGRWRPPRDEILKTLERINADGLDTHANFEVLDPAFVRELRSRGLEFHAWTVNDVKKAVRLMQLGIDSITTDRPEFLRKGLLAWKEKNVRARSETGERLPAGFVQGDVVSYSHVPIRTWTPKEGLGILPYLFEYNLMQHKDGVPLAAYHAENVRRIDIAGAWSTAVMLYPRHAEYRDEIINLMLRCFRNRQLIILADYCNGTDSYGNICGILNKLWEKRDTMLENPEGDRATGRQLINNILANKCGDEGLSGLGTDGLYDVYDLFAERVQNRELDGEKPFRHIKAWYNMIGYAALDYNGPYAAGSEDVAEHKRQRLPSNAQAIGVDVYHYWGHGWSPFDPADLSIPRYKVAAHSREWQRLRTRYYPEGVKVRVCSNSHDPETWIPECWSDTHALMQGLEFAGAENAMMWYIGVSGQLDGSGGTASYTTPIETMEAYYNELKAGPWVALSWWNFGTFKDMHGGLEYYDRTLLHHTPEHPEGRPYSKELLDYWHREYVALKLRMFRDVLSQDLGRRRE